MAENNGFGVQIGFEFDSFESVDKVYKDYIKRLSEGAKLKVNFDQGDLKEIQNEFNKLQKVEFKMFDSGAINRIRTFKNAIGELLTITQHINNNGDETNKTFSFKSTKDIETQKALYAQLGNLQKLQYDLQKQMIKAEGEKSAELQRQLEYARELQGQYILAINKTGLEDKEKENNLMRQAIELNDKLRIAQKAKADEELKNQQKILNALTEQQTKMSKTLNVAKGNEILNPEVFDRLQNSINKLTVDTPKARIESLKQSIDNIGGSETKIVSLQSTIHKITQGLENMNITSKDVMNLDSSKQEVEALENKLKEANDMLSKLKNNGNVSTGSYNSIISGLNNSFGDVKNIVSQNNELMKLNKTLDEFESKKVKLQQKLNIIASDGFLNPSTIKNLQGQLDKLNFDNFESKYKQLETAINNLSKSENRILKLQNAINDVKGSFDLLKTYDGDILNLDTSVDAVKQLEIALTDASRMLAMLKKNSQSVTQTNFNNVTANLKDSMNNVQNIVKNTKAYQEERKAVENLIEKKIALLEIEKQKVVRQFGDKYDTSSIDEYIRRLKTMNNMSFKEVQNEISKMNVELRQAAETARSSESIFEKFGSTLNKFGIYINLADIMRGVREALRNVTEEVARLDDVYTDLNITMTVSKAQFKELSSALQTVAIDLGADLQNVMDIAKIYSNGTTTVANVIDMLKPLTAISNVAGINGEQATKAVQTTINAFDGLKEELGDTESIATHFGDVMVGVAKDMSYDFQSAYQEIVAAIRNGGSVAATAGMSFEEYASVMGALIERTGRTGDELSNSFKFIAARTLQIKELGDELDISSKDMGKAERALTDLGISVRGSDGSLRSLMDILRDVSSRWGNLTDQEKQYTSEALAGNRQRAVFISLMQSMEKQQVLLNDAMSSNGELMEANDKWVDSYAGKMASLESTISTFFASLVETDTVKGFLSMVTSVVSGATSIVDKFGALPVVVGLVSTALFALNKNFREFVTSSNLPVLGTINKKFEALRVAIAGTTTATKTETVAQGVNAASKTANAAATTTLTIAQKAMTVATYAAQAALTMGLGIALGVVINKAIDFIDKLHMSREELAEFNEEATSNISQSTEAVKTSQDLLIQKVELEKQLSLTTEDSSKHKEIKSELIDIERQLADTLPSSISGYDEQGKAISANTELIKAEIQAKKDSIIADAEEMLSNNKKKLASQERIQDLQKELELMRIARDRGESTYNKDVIVTSGVNREQKVETRALGFDDKDIQKKQQQLEDYRNQLNKVKYAIEQLRAAGKSDSQIEEQLGMSIAQVDELTKSLNENTSAKLNNSNTEIQVSTSQAVHNIDILQAALNELNEKEELSKASTDALAKMLPNLDLSAMSTKEKIEALTEALNKQKEAMDDNSKAIAKQGQVDFVTQAEEMDKINGYLYDMKKNGDVTIAIMKELANNEVFADFAGDITNATQVQDYFNKKLGEMKDVQAEAYQQMMGNSQEYYKAQISNGNQLQNAFDQWAKNFVDINGDGYTFDSRNFNTLNEAKAAMCQQLARPIAEWIASFTGGNADGYEADLRNFTDLAQQKQRVLEILNQQISIVNSNMANAAEKVKKYSDTINEGNMNAPNIEQAYSKAFYWGDRYDKAAAQLDNLNSAIKKVGASYSQFNKTFSSYTPKYGGVSSYKGTDYAAKDREAAKKAEEDYQKERERLEREANSTIESFRNKLINALKKKYEAMKKAELEPLDKEIEIRQKELDRLRNGGLTGKERELKLQEQISKWKQDDSAYAQQKVDELTKELQEQKLENEIDDLEKQKVIDASYVEKSA